jgi:hypothetical protein
MTKGKETMAATNGVQKNPDLAHAAAADATAAGLARSDTKTERRGRGGWQTARQTRLRA